MIDFGQIVIVRSQPKDRDEAPKTALVEALCEFDRGQGFIDRVERTRKITRPAVRSRRRRPYPGRFSGYGRVSGARSRSFDSARSKPRPALSAAKDGRSLCSFDARTRRNRESRRRKNPRPCRSHNNSRGPESGEARQVFYRDQPSFERFREKIKKENLKCQVQQDGGIQAAPRGEDRRPVLFVLSFFRRCVFQWFSPPKSGWQKSDTRPARLPAIVGTRPGPCR